MASKLAQKGASTAKYPLMRYICRQLERPRPTPDCLRFQYYHKNAFTYYYWKIIGEQLAHILIEYKYIWRQGTVQAIFFRLPWRIYLFFRWWSTTTGGKQSGLWYHTKIFIKCFPLAILDWTIIE